MFQMAVGQLTAGFQAHAVNLLVAHTHLHGAAFGGSERAVHLGEDWAAPVQVLPTTAHYIALGHIHKPQQIEGAVPARYAGSALQLDFGEAGDEKSFVLVEAEPRTRATVTPVPYEGGIPLGEAAGTLDELEASASEYRQAGWLRVTVKLDAPDPEINRKVRQLLPNATKVRVDLPKQEHDGANMDDGNVDSRSRPAERFKAYYHHTNRTLGDRVLAAFVELLEEEETAE
jgi:exonuclease SbcD